LFVTPVKNEKKKCEGNRSTSGREYDSQIPKENRSLKEGIPTCLLIDRERERKDLRKSRRRL